MERDVEVGERRPEAGIAVVPAASGRLQEAGISARDGDDVEAPRPAVRVEVLVDVNAELAAQASSPNRFMTGATSLRPEPVDQVVMEVPPGGRF